MISQEDVPSGASAGLCSRSHAIVMGGFEPFQSAAQASSLRLSAQLPVPVAVGTSFNGGVLPKGLGYRDKDSISSALHHRPAFPPVADTVVTLLSVFCHFKALLIRMFHHFHWTLPQRRGCHRERTKTRKRALTNH